jgi:hypothetical protein
MTTQTKDTLDLKIDAVKSITKRILEDSRETDAPDAEIDQMLDVLEQYEYFLLRQKLQMITTMDDLSDIKKAIRDAGCLLVDLGCEEQELMVGWYHGAEPKNMAYAVANLLSRIILELTAGVCSFEEAFPQYKAFFDAERNHYAKLLQDKLDKEEKQR